MQALCPDDGRVMACQFRGDPYQDVKGKWRARVLNDPSMIDPGANVYLCVSAMGPNERGEWRRRKVNFRGGLLLMVDDVGTGPGSKFPVDALANVPPSVMVETSPENFQAVYLFDEAEQDPEKFDALIRAFIDQQFLEKDTGMAGVNRVFRPPVGVNGKPKYGGWQCRGAQWNLDQRWNVDALAAAFGLTLVVGRPFRPADAFLKAAQGPRIRAFVEARTMMRRAGMLKRETVDRSGWQDVVCPWVENHTGAADTGAAIREPDADNGWHGGFRCHHGGCDGKGWRALTDWLAEESEVVLERVNERAPATMIYDKEQQ